MRFYGLSKARAMTAGITFTLICVLILAVTKGQGACCTTFFFPYIAWCGLSLYKHWKVDQNILAIKHEVEAETLSRIDPPQAIMPPIESTKSNGALFVPDPRARGH